MDIDRVLWSWMSFWCHHNNHECIKTAEIGSRSITASLQGKSYYAECLSRSVQLTATGTLSKVSSPLMCLYLCILNILEIFWSEDPST